MRDKWIFDWHSNSVHCDCISSSPRVLSKQTPHRNHHRVTCQSSIPKRFAATHDRMSAAKPGIMKRQKDLLAERYDLSNRPATGVMMDRSKPVQGRCTRQTVRRNNLAQLAGMTPQQVRDKDLFPQGFLPLPHANHPEGGMVFPDFEIKEILKQEERDLTRFDLDFDLPDQFSSRISARHLPDNAARPRRCLQRTTCHHCKLL